VRPWWVLDAGSGSSPVVDYLFTVWVWGMVPFTLAWLLFCAYDTARLRVHGRSFLGGKDRPLLVYAGFLPALAWPLALLVFSLWGLWLLLVDAFEARLRRAS
jgi:hypothetical protein